MRRHALVRLLAPAAVFLLLAAACGGDGGDGNGGDGTTDGGTPEAQFTTITEGVLTVGSCLDYPPFESVEGGDETGFDVDLTEAIAEKLGLEVEWVRADFDTIFTAVAGGEFDMVAAAVTATGPTGEERAQIVSFSDFYYNSRQSLAVNTAETPDITSTDQLGEGDTVGVQKGTTGKEWAEENLEPQGVEIRTFGSITDGFRDLEAGNLTAIINDEPSSEEVVQTLEGVEVVQPIDTNEKYAFAFSQDNPELVDAVNVALQEVIDDGTYEEIFAEYFPGVEVPEEFQPSG